MDIIATIGPSIEATEQLTALIQSRVTNFRIPLSKGFPEQQLLKAIEISQIGRALNRRIRLYIDLPGSKARLTNDSVFHFHVGALVRFTCGYASEANGNHIPCVGVAGSLRLESLAIGDIILIGDGEHALKVTEVHLTSFIASSLTSGILEKRRGIVIQGKPLDYNTQSDRDESAVEFLKHGNISGVMVSFVESKKDILEVKEKIRSAIGSRGVLPELVAKIETLRGITNIADICSVADKVMVARGDLLLNVGPVDFYEAEEEIINTAMEMNVPIIVGTQLLDSMSASWLPNRSELSAVSHLIARGIDGLLLTAETAVGSHPLRTVELINTLVDKYRIIANPTVGNLPLRGKKRNRAILVPTYVS